MAGGGIPPDPDAKIRSVAADEIDIGEALRPIDPIWVLDLAHRMIAAGQDMPVTLWRPRPSGKYAIVEGAHRVAAAQRFSGLSPLDAILLDAAGADRRAAAIENALRRGEVSALRAQALIADLYALHAVSMPDEDHRDRLARIARRCGSPSADIAAALARHACLAPHVAEMIGEVDVMRDPAQLEMLAHCTHAEQQKIAYLLLSGIRSVGEALAEWRRAARQLPDAARVAEFITLFEGMSLAEKEDALLRLGRLTPAHVEIRWTAG